MPVLLRSRPPTSAAAATAAANQFVKKKSPAVRCPKLGPVFVAALGSAPRTRKTHKEKVRAIVRLPLHRVQLYRRLVNFAHVSVVHSGNLPVVPSDRNRIPSRFGDNAAVSGIALPVNAGILFEGF
jgi:hypothetical protein